MAKMLYGMWTGSVPSTTTKGLLVKRRYPLGIKQREEEWRISIHSFAESVKGRWVGSPGNAPVGTAVGNMQLTEDVAGSTDPLVGGHEMLRVAVLGIDADTQSMWEGGANTQTPLSQLCTVVDQRALQEACIAFSRGQN